MGCGFPIGFAGFERSVETVRRAVSLGIHYFDTSPLYRAGASQAIVGEALAERDEPHLLATKVGHFKEARFFRSVEAMRVQLRENLRLLRRDAVDVLQVHEADWENWWVDRSDVGVCELFDPQKSYDFAGAPVVEFLRQAKAEGFCRYIGITGNNARHLTRLVAELDGIDSVLVAYNTMPLNASARDDLLPAAHKKGMAIVAAGLMTFVHRIPPGWRTEGTYFGKHAEEQLAALQKLQNASGLSMAELVLRWGLADDRISTLLVGACQPPEVEANAAAIVKGRLPADLHEAIEIIARQFER